MLSTHLVEDIAAVCTNVVVLWQGQVLFHGQPALLRERAEGMVWLADSLPDSALLSWRTEDGALRVIGPRPGTAAVGIEPTLEDAYLLLTNSATTDARAAMSVLSVELQPVHRGRSPARSRAFAALDPGRVGQVGTSAVLLLGLLGGVLVSLGAAGSEWPLLTGSAGLIYRQANTGIANLPVGGLRFSFLSFVLMPSGWLVLAGFAMLAGTLLGRRDRRSGAEELLAVTPISGAGIRAARLAALALASSIALALVFGAVLVAEAVSGARGSTDWLILLDGCLGTTLASWIGYGVGSSLPAAFSLFVPIVYVGGSFYLSVWQGTSTLGSSIEWLLQTPPAPTWSADLGFLPNIFPEHIAYLGALLLLTGGVMIALPLRRGTGQPERHRGVLAAAILGLAMAVWLGAVLQAKPDSYAMASPNPATWAPEYNTVPDNIGFDCILVPDSPSASSQGAATTCDVSAWLDAHGPVSCRRPTARSGFVSTGTIDQWPRDVC